VTGIAFRPRYSSDPAGGMTLQAFACPEILPIRLFWFGYRSFSLPLLAEFVLTAPECGVLLAGSVHSRFWMGRLRFCSLISSGASALTAAVLASLVRNRLEGQPPFPLWTDAARGREIRRTREHCIRCPHDLRDYSLPAALYGLEISFAPPCAIGVTRWFPGAWCWPFGFADRLYRDGQ
jgi:hypothetical protein